MLERDFICPSCGKKIPSLDKLLVDKPARTRVWDYIERTIEESKKGEGEEGDELFGGRRPSRTLASCVVM